MTNSESRDTQNTEPHSASHAREYSSQWEASKVAKDGSVVPSTTPFGGEREDGAIKRTARNAPHTAEVGFLKLKSLLYTLVQGFGFYLILMSVYELFGPAIEAEGISLDWMPKLLIDTYAGIGFTPMVLFFAGLIIVYVSTGKRF